MDKSFQWIHGNMDLVFLVYGAAFFLLGITILVQPKRGSTFQLASILWLLAVFGLVHGANEWLDMWKITHGTNLPIKLLGLFCLLLSYGFLFEFGRRLVVLTGTESPVWQHKLFAWLGWKVYGPLIGGVLLAGLISENPWIALNIWSRYLLGFTGALLTGIGFLLYYRNEEKRLAALRIKPYFMWATLAFVVYGIASGLVVPAAGYFPASRFNYDTFLATTQLPVQVFRAAAVVLAAFAVTKMLRMFRWEADYRLENALKQAHDSLVKVKELSYRNALILKAVGDGIIGVDVQGVCTFANPAGQKMLGYKEQQLIGRSVHDILQCAKVDCETYNNSQECPLYCMVREAREGSVPDCRFLRSDGSTVDVEYVVMPIKEQGEVVGTVVTFSDIIERKQAEEELQKSKALLNDTGRMANVGGWEINLETQELTWTDEVYHIHEIGLDYIPTVADAINFYAPQSIPLISGAIQRAFDDGEPFDLELQLITAKENLIWVHAIGKAHLGDGKPIRVSGTFQDITERKQAEQELQTSETKYRNLYNTMAQGVVYQIADGQIISANTAAERILGLTLEQMQGRTSVDPHWKAIKEDGSDFPGEEHPAMVSLKTGQPVSNVIMGVFHPDQEKYCWISIDAVPQFRQGEKTPYQAFTTFTDITERKRAEEEVRKNEHCLAEAQRMANIGSWELDLVTNQLDWSNEVYRIFEIDPHKFGASYEAFLDEIHPDDREQVNTAYTESVKNKTPYSVEHRLRMPDGTIKHVQEGCETFYDNEGNPVRSVGTVQDITERYQTEQTLKRLNRSLQALSACNEALVRTTDETELLNKVCRIIVEISGYRLAWVGFAEHNEAKTIRPVAESGYDEGYLDSLELTWADTERGQGPTGIAIRTGKPRIIRNILEDPRYTPWRQTVQKHGYSSFIALPLKNKEQTFGVLNIYACEEDAFDEAEVRLLQELADDLAYGIVALRSHEERRQLNKQLRQAQKMEAIGQLTGGIAHDFNNILASMMGYTELALDRFGSKGPGKLREYLQEVYTAGERARDLISQMLIFSRVESSKPFNISVVPVVKEALKMLESIIPSSIELHSVIGNKIAKVCIDPAQLQQIVFNLCINARDAISGNGAIEVLLKEETHVTGNCDACRKSFDGEFVELCVTDTGEGIAPEVMDKMFEPFFTTKVIGNGTGMGLSTIQGIVHSAGGHVLVERVPESGAAFRLLLPAAELANNLDPENTNKSLDKKTGNKSSEQDAVQVNACILVVDDELSVSGFMRDYLLSRGYSVATENDGQAALATFKANPDQFDIVLTDQTMPKMTGLEMSKEFLKIRPNLPIVLCTGYSADVNAEIARDAGIGAFLMKPIVPSELQRIVEELLQKPS